MNSHFKKWFYPVYSLVLFALLFVFSELFLQLHKQSGATYQMTWDVLCWVLLAVYGALLWASAQFERKEHAMTNLAVQIVCMVLFAGSTFVCTSLLVSESIPLAFLSAGFFGAGAVRNIIHLIRSK